MSVQGSNERRQIAKIAGLTSWANTPDRTARTQPGREAFLRRFEDQVDPDRLLIPLERAKRAEAAKKAYFAALALKSVKARRRGGGLEQQRAAEGASQVVVDRVLATAQTLTAEQRAELAALLLTGGDRA